MTNVKVASKFSLVIVLNTVLMSAMMKFDSLCMVCEGRKFCEDFFGKFRQKDTPERESFPPRPYAAHRTFMIGVRRCRREQ
jgi:hypothetical protein